MFAWNTFCLNEYFVSYTQDTAKMQLRTNMFLKTWNKKKNVYTAFLGCSTVNETRLLQECITLMPYELPNVKDFFWVGQDIIDIQYLLYPFSSIKMKWNPFRSEFTITTVMPYFIPYHTTYSCLSNSTMKPKIQYQSLITWNFH